MTPNNSILHCDHKTEVFSQSKEFEYEHYKALTIIMFMYQLNKETLKL